MQPAPDDAARISRGYRICTARAPSAGEIEEVAGLLRDSRSWYRAHEEDASKLAGPGGTSSSVSESAAWTAVARVLLNLDAFLTRE